jgi:hypothetical protein
MEHYEPLTAKEIFFVTIRGGLQALFEETKKNLSCAVTDIHAAMNHTGDTFDEEIKSALTFIENAKRLESVRRSISEEHKDDPWGVIK